MTASLLQRVRPLAAMRARHAADQVHPLLAVACLGAIGLGVALRVAGFWTADLWWDGQIYAVMAQSWADGKAFLMPWGEAGSLVADPGWSHHYAPLYPMYLSVWYDAFGFSGAVTKAASIALGIAALAVLYAALADVASRGTALLTASLAAVDPHLIWVTATGFSENLVLITFALTLWAIIRSLAQPHFMALAGLFAGLGYLTRASLGALFVLAGIAGLGWRFYHRRWAVLRDHWYMAGITVFAALALAWTARNVHLFGWDGWATSEYIAGVQACVLRDLLGACSFPNGEAASRFALALAAKLPLFAIFAALWALPFLPELRVSLRRWREERESVLWVAIGLVFFTAWLSVALLWAAEDSNLWWPDNRRYVVIALVPLVLAAGRHARFDTRGFARRATALLAILAVLSAAVLALPPRFPQVAAAESLAPSLAEGDVISVHGRMDHYGFYTSVADAGVRVCVLDAWVLYGLCQPDYVISTGPGQERCLEDNGFQLQPEHTRRVDYLLPGWESLEATVWKRVADVPANAEHCRFDWL